MIVKLASLLWGGAWRARRGRGRRGGSCFAGHQKFWTVYSRRMN